MKTPKLSLIQEKSQESIVKNEAITQNYFELHPDKILNVDNIVGNLLASFVFVCLGLMMRAFFWFVLSFFQKDRLFGEWHHYFINLQDKKPIFRHDIMRIVRGFMHPMAVCAVSDDGIKSRYVGYAVKEKDFLIVNSKSKGDSEIVFQRFKLRPIGGKDILVGIASAQDYDGYASAHISIMSREPLSEEEFIKITNERTQVYNRTRIIKLT